MKVLAMTGGTSGIGEVAAKHMLARRDARVLIGGRTMGPDGAEFLRLDLSSLHNSRRFAETIRQRLGERRIDALILNAGLHFPNVDQRTVDGFETTFAVNHLAQFLILRLLEPQLAEEAIVVITTSNSHDPNSSPIPPAEPNARLLAYPGVQTDDAEKPFLRGFRAYSTSKLCNVLTACALAVSSHTQQHRIRVVAYNPGFTPGTGLGRGMSLLMRLVTKVVAPIVSPFARIITIAQADETLAAIAMGQIIPPQGRIYASLVRRKLTWPDPSKMALRDDLRDELWRDSAILAGIPTEMTHVDMDLAQ